MNNSDLKHLALVKNAIEEFFQFQTHLIEPSEFNSIHTLVCNLPQGPLKLDRVMNFMFIPFEENGKEEIKMLQFYSILPGATLKDVDEKLKDLLLHISHRTMLGNFSINNGSEISFRYVYPVSKANGITPTEFSENVSLFLLTLDMFSVKLKDYADGSISLDAILRDI